MLREDALCRLEDGRKHSTNARLLQGRQIRSHTPSAPSHCAEGEIRTRHRARPIREADETTAPRRRRDRAWFRAWSTTTGWRPDRAPPRAHRERRGQVGAAPAPYGDLEAVAFRARASEAAGFLALLRRPRRGSPTVRPVRFPAVSLLRRNTQCLCVRSHHVVSDR